MFFSRHKWLTLLITLLALGAGRAQAAAEVGQAPPAFELSTSSGNPLTLAQLRGQVVYLDFWASWCAPCRQSFPWMADLHRRYAAQGFSVVAVNVDTRATDAQAFLKVNPAPFTVLFDATGRTPRAYGIKAMPTSVLIGRDGKVLAVHGGFKPSDTAGLESMIESALKEPR